MSVETDYWRESWNDMLRRACEEDGEDFAALTVTVGMFEWREVRPGNMDEVFDTCYGGDRGCSFTAWGKDWVYFPICYDGAVTVGHAPRNPCDIAMEHQGGG